MRISPILVLVISIAPNFASAATFKTNAKVTVESPSGKRSTSGETVDGEIQMEGSAWRCIWMYPFTKGGAIRHSIRCETRGKPSAQIILVAHFPGALTDLSAVRSSEVFLLKSPNEPDFHLVLNVSAE